MIDIVKEVAEFIPLEKGRQLSAAHLLERFLFPRDMHYQFVSKLSGGEKRRLKLLRVLMANPNFLVLDEPTNDLDIFSMAALENYLSLFEGSLVVISHDRYFMDKITDHLFVFEGEGRKGKRLELTMHIRGSWSHTDTSKTVVGYGVRK